MERRDVTAGSSFEIIEDGTEIVPPEPTLLGSDTWQYVDSDVSLVAGPARLF